MGHELNRKVVQRAISTCFSQLNGDPMLAWRIKFNAQRAPSSNKILPFEKRYPCNSKSDSKEHQGSTSAENSNNRHS